MGKGDRRLPLMDRALGAWRGGHVGTGAMDVSVSRR
jgi:hypothetical protein